MNEFIKRREPLQVAPSHIDELSEKTEIIIVAGDNFASHRRRHRIRTFANLDGDSVTALSANTSG
ncbi:MAG: hypothetical protein ABI614_17035 [Planctomycetota bacterium]